MSLLKPIALALTVLGLTACQNAATPKPTTIAASTALLPPLSAQFACLPSGAAIIAAHRGNSRDMGLAENAMPSLKALHEGGILMAEVDVAGLKDGVHILFHDGVWKEDTTGTGVVAASTYDQVSTYLLRDNKGKLTSAVPAKLEDALAFAKNRLYMEIDFKSSAKYDHVISAIREAGMAQHVILIAYNDGQAKKLAEMAPEMVISASVRDFSDIARYEGLGLKRENISAWLGTMDDDRSLAESLNTAGIPVLAMGRRSLSSYKDNASVLVSDYALSDKANGQYPGIVGLSGSDVAAYETCLAEKS